MSTQAEKLNKLIPERASVWYSALVAKFEYLSKRTYEGNIRPLADHEAESGWELHTVCPANWQTKTDRDGVAITSVGDYLLVFKKEVE